MVSVEMIDGQWLVAPEELKVKPLITGDLPDEIQSGEDN